VAQVPLFLLMCCIPHDEYAPATLAQRTLIDQSQLKVNLLEELGDLKGKEASIIYMKHM